MLRDIIFYVLLCPLITFYNINNRVMRIATTILFCFLLSMINAQSLSSNELPTEKLILPSDREKINISHLSYLNQAKQVGSRNSFSISLPIRGKSILFSAIPNEVIDDEFRRQFPDILTYDLTALDGSHLKGALTLSTVGLYATILNAGKMISIYPEDVNTQGSHIIEYGFQPDLPQPKQFCGHDHEAIENSEIKTPRNFGKRMGTTMGDRRFNYRVAIVTTGEFYVKNGNNDNAVRTVVVNSVNSISAIFNNELSYRLTVGTRIFLYNNPNTDPFIPDGAGGQGRTVQAGNIVPMQFASNLFDIGHVFHQHEDGDNWGNGGVAQLQSVCDNSTFFGPLNKASAWSGGYSNVGNGWISLATHEFGHQFGANHTFNGLGESCTDAISLTNAYEIGSGTTIMSYNGICNADQNIPSGDVLDNYFHIKSLEEMYDYVTFGEGGSCGNPVTSSNIAPSVDANPCNTTYTIPKGTPFYLKAEGQWTDTDTHTYCWEQIDEDGAGKPTQGFIGTQAGNSTITPLFRSFPPSASPERYFPSLETIISGVASPFEVSPNVARNLNFNVSLRDNNGAGGAVANDDITIVVNNTGPFRVTRPNGFETFQAGQVENFTWNTGGSNALCNMMRIKLSIDGGRTYPIIIAENISYAAGTFSFMIPSNFVRSTQARVMMECMDFDCFRIFNVSSSNFTINSTCTPENSVLCPTTDVSLDAGDPGLNLNMTKVVGNRITSISRPITDNLPLGQIAVKGLDGVGCHVASGNYYYNRVNVYVTETGSYSFNVGSGFVSLFRSNFNAASACNSFVSSSATDAGGMSIFREGTMTVQLTACTQYVLVFYSFANLPTNAQITNVTGPGFVIESISAPAPAYQSVYIIVNDATGLIERIGQNTDMTATPAGNYTIYSMVISSGTNLTSYVGQPFTSLTSTECLNLSYNSRKVEIKSSCVIESITVGTQTPCVISTNIYTQQLTLTYDKPPVPATLNVNGQLFPVTSSPQTVTLVNLDSDGLPVNVNAFFVEAPSCAITQPNLFNAPANCCPVVLELGPDLNQCVGDMVSLNAGTSGQTYKWFRNGIEITTQILNTLTVSSDGVYSVEVIHSSGCIRRDAVTVTFNPRPSALLAPNIEFCQNTTVTLEPTINGGQSFEWFRNNILISGESASTLDISQGGTYKLVVTNSFDCTSEVQTIATTKAAPVVNLGPDEQLCENDDIILNAGSEGITYEWYKDDVLIPNQTSSQLTPMGSGIYRVIVQNASLCFGEDQMDVRFFASPIVEDFPDTTNVCQGNPANLLAVAQDFTSLQWFYENNPINGSNSLSLVANNSGFYTIEATNNIGCKTSKSTQVEVRSLPVVNLEDRVACIGATVELKAGSEGVTYEWKRNGLLLSNTANFLVVTQAGNYSVDVTNQYDCTSTSEADISFVPGPSLEIIGGDTAICSGDTYLILAQSSDPNATIRWIRNGDMVLNNPSFGLSVTEGGNYLIEITGGNPSCTVSESVNITVNPIPGVNLMNDRTICEGQPFPVLNGGNNQASYNWTLNGVPFGTSQVVTADKTGTYRVVVTNEFDCENSDEVKVTIEPLPTLALNNNYNLCEGEELTIVAASNANKFEWKKGGIVIPGVTTNTISITEAGTYSCVVTSVANCTKESTFTVTLQSAPVVSLVEDITLCPGISASISVPINPNQTYKWSDGSTSSTLIIAPRQPLLLTDVKYTVTVTNAQGCASIDSINITFLPIVQATVTTDKPGVCNGEPVILTASGGVNYTWIDPTGTLSTTTGPVTTASPEETTEYKVVVDDGVCLQSGVEETIEIEVFESAEISAGLDTCVITGRTIKLAASGGVSYQWDNTDLIVGPSNVADPVVKPLLETVFTVTVTDRNGCEFSDEVTICILEDPLAFFKEVSIITPNGDGKNDALYFSGLEAFPDNSLKIFNRWGNLIFEQEGYQTFGNLFEGLRNGDKLPADTYYYILTFEDKVVKSSLTILWN